MESLLVDLKNASEKKVLTAFLKSLKMNYHKISIAKEDAALAKAMNEGKLRGRASGSQQKQFEQWLNSL